VSEKDAEGKMVMMSEGSVKIQADKVDEAQKRLNDLDAIDVLLPEIKVSDLGKQLELTAVDLLALEFLVE
jgi:RIO-like serine/threonine protein kinase